MGLPLYIAPVESDLRNKGASRNSAAQARSTIRRQRRRSTEAMRESRRRAIFAAAAAYPSSTPSELLRERERDTLVASVDPALTTQQDDVLSHDFVPSNIRERLVQRFLERVRQQHDDRSRTATSASQDRWQDSPWASLAANAPPLSGRRTPGGTGGAAPPLSTTTSSTATGAATRLTAAPAAGSGGRPLSPVPRHPRHAVDDDHFYSPFLVDQDWMTNRARTYHAVFGGPEVFSVSSANRTGNGNGNSSNNDRSNHHGGSSEIVGRHGLDGHDDHELTDAFIVETDPDADADIDTDQVTAPSSFGHRHPPVRRLAIGRPSVGWLDHGFGSQAGRFSGSRRYGASGNASSGNNNNGDDNEASSNSAANPAADTTGNDQGPSSLRDAWLHQPYEATALPPIRMILGGVDGLGDRSRSLSPEGDTVWDTLLSTLTPDPQPPSLGSSFTSTAPAMATTTTTGPTTNNDATTGATISGGGRQPTPIPDLEVAQISALVSPPATLSAVSAESFRGPRSSSTGGGTASGTTSASASQRVRSPFTALSLSTTDTANTPEEETSTTTLVLQEAAAGLDPDLDEYPLGQPQTQETEPLDTGCDDSEMDGDDEFTGVSRNGTYLQREEISQERSTLRMGGMMARGSLGPSSSRRSGGNGNGHGNGAGSRNGIGRRSTNGVSNGGIRRREINNGSSSTTTSSNISSLRRNIAAGNEDTLELLGIGGMQNIVRNLARRQDIPDEWWAEAGLSRTLRRQVAE